MTRPVIFRDADCQFTEHKSSQTLLTRDFLLTGGYLLPGHTLSDPSFRIALLSDS